MLPLKPSAQGLFSYRPKIHCSGGLISPVLNIKKHVQILLWYKLCQTVRKTSFFPLAPVCPYRCDK